MTFRGEMNDCPGTMGPQDVVNELLIADIATYEGVTLIVSDRCQIGQIAGVGQLIKVDHRRWFRGHPMVDEIGANKARTAGD